MTGQRLVYLASPIDQASGGTDLYFMRGRAAEMVMTLGMALYRPEKAFLVASEMSVGPEVAAINAEALRQASGLLALVPAGVPSIGVPMEIEAARLVGKPVAVVSDAESWSLATPGVTQFPWTNAGLRDAVQWLFEQKQAEWATETAWEQMPVQLLKNGRMPSRAHYDDAGLDLYVSEERTVEVGEFVDIPCGVAVELPGDTWGYLTGRSSTLRRRGLLVNPGVIDAGYRGPLFAGVFNLGQQEQVIEVGDRIAQLIVIGNRTVEVQPVVVDELREHPRGEKGFGSSGW